MGLDWQKILLTAGGAAGAAAVLYYLFREDEELDRHLEGSEIKTDSKTDTKADSKAESKAATGGDVATNGVKAAVKVGKAAAKAVAKGGKEELLLILHRIVTAKTSVRQLSEVADKPIEEFLDQFCSKADLRSVLEGPFAAIEEDFGVTAEKFQEMVIHHQADPAVRELFMQIEQDGIPPIHETMKFTEERILEILKHLEKEARQFVTKFQSLPEATKRKWDSVTVFAGAMVWLDCRGKKLYGWSKECLDLWLPQNHTKLKNPNDFVAALQQPKMALAALLPKNGRASIP